MAETQRIEPKGIPSESKVGFEIPGMENMTISSNGPGMTVSAGTIVWNDKPEDAA